MDTHHVGTLQRGSRFSTYRDKNKPDFYTFLDYIINSG